MYDEKRNTGNASDLFHAADLDGSIRPTVPAESTPSAPVNTAPPLSSPGVLSATPTPSATNPDLMATRYMGDSPASGPVSASPMYTTPPMRTTPPMHTTPPMRTTPPMHTTPPMRTTPPMHTMPPRGTTPPRSVTPSAGSGGGSSGKSLLQIQIYTRKFLRTLKKESLISIIIGIIITLLVMYVTYDGMFETFESTKSGLFALICVCVWLGIFNSIQLVCREKNDIVKDELDKSLHATSYMAAHFIYQAVLCAIQSALVFIIFLLFVSPDGNLFAYFLTIYLVMFASDAMSFVLSAVVPNPIVAMTFMPLLLLIQLVMAGVMFELSGFSNILSYCTISRWGMSAFGLIGNIDALPSKVQFPGLDYSPLTDTDKSMYEGGTGDLCLCLFMFVLFIVAFYFLSVLALKLTTRRIKK